MPISPAVGVNTHSLLSERFPELSKQNLEATVERLGEWSPNLQKAIINLPKGPLGFLLAANFAEAIYQTLQEILTQLIPKVVVASSKIISSKPDEEPIAKTLARCLPPSFDEASIEVLEYGTLYYFLTILAIFQNNIWSKLFKLPHPEVLGARVYDLEQNMGNKMKFGTLNSKEVLINRELINKVSFFKTFGFLSVVLATTALEIVVAGIRPLITKFVFKTDNFDEISGLNVNKGHEHDGEAAIFQAKENIKHGLLSILASVPAFIGLAGLLYKTGIYQKTNFFTGFAKRFALGDRSGLSRISLITPIVIGAGLGYNLAARSLSEIKENFFRMIFLSWLSILFFKPIVGNVGAGLTGLAYGVNVLKNPFRTWHDEVIGKNAGKRDPLDIGFVRTKEELLELPKVKNMKEEKQEKFIKRISFMKQKAPIYIFALPMGFFFAWMNYQRTKKINLEQAQNKTESKHEYKGIRGWMEEIVDKLSNWVYNMQQSNYKQHVNNRASLKN